MLKGRKKRLKGSTFPRRWNSPPPKLAELLSTSRERFEASTHTISRKALYFAIMSEVELVAQERPAVQVHVEEDTQAELLEAKEVMAPPASKNVESSTTDMKNQISFNLNELFGGEKADAKRDNTFEWHDLHVAINGNNIINGVSGQIKDGELCAVLGASGAGKSTFLNVLAGRAGHHKKYNITGDVSSNFVKLDPLKFKTNIAYVMQEDALFPTSTPREEIELAAFLRTVYVDGKPVETVDPEKLIDALGLTECQDVCVGTKLMKGLSGGEKTRTSIAVELVSKPHMVFLDEPTSGLDSYSAWTVVKLLQSLAQSGRMVSVSV
jgi:ABC-type lipoprotein export system ATPase subunit